MATWTDVARLVKALPGVTETERRQWRVNDKLVAWERPLRRADVAALGKEAPTGPILAVYAPLDIKEVLLAARPKVFFTTPHFDGWPAVLIRLPAIRVGELRDRLRGAWLERAPRKIVAESEGAKPPTRGMRAKPPALRKPA